MEQSAIIAMEKSREIRRLRLEEHKIIHSQDRGCRGLTEQEWNKCHTRQKQTFRKVKKYSYTRLWNHYHVTL